MQGALYLSACKDCKPDFETQAVISKKEMGEINANNLPDVDSELIAVEGGQKIITHLLRERDGKIIQAKKQQVLRETGKLTM